ncbi:hypothetical protein F383_23757 [Gossypium arboreum]|nr:hypothetical protein F383_23757 [Gossypium arboreum]
MRNRLDF